MVLKKINRQMKILKKKAIIIVIDDCSNKKMIKLKKFNNIKKIQILKLKKNLGSQKAISIGLKYLNNLKIKSIITVLDSDGEDDVKKITEMIKLAEKNPEEVVVSCRTKRHENIFFKVLYLCHKLITFFFTLNWISFGSFSSFNSKNLEKILKNRSSWLAFSASVSKNCNLIKLYAERKKRYLGNSKLSFYDLVNHSLRVNAVFLNRAIVLSLFYNLVLINFIQIEFIYVYVLMSCMFVYIFAMLIIFILNRSSDFYFSNKFIARKIIL